MRATLRIAAALVGLVAVALAAPAWSARLATARVGQHADFTRIVFELDGQAGYRVERSVGPEGQPQLVVTLAATLGPNAPRTIRSGSSLLESVTLEQPQDRIVATIRLRDQALPVKEMILANPPRIVLDVLGTDTKLARKPQPRPAPAVAVAPKPAPAPAPEPEVEEAKPTPVAVAPRPVAPHPVPERVAPTPEPEAAPAEAPKPTPIAELPKPRPAPVPEPTPVAEPEPAAQPEAESEAESAAREAMDRRLAAVREAAEQRRRQLEQEKREKELQVAQERLAQEKQRQREEAAAEQSAAPAPAAPAGAGPNRYLVGAAGGLLLFALVLAVVLIRRRTLPRDLDVTAFDDSDQEPRFAAEEDTPETSTSSRREPLTAPGEREAPLSAPGLFDESEKGESEMEPHAQDLPIERSEPFARSARGADVSGAIAELERRMAALETRLQESNAARERLERQVAAQSEELRVQRAAIARTQRALRGLSRSEEEQATEPALRD